MQDKVSIIVCTHNRQHKLSQCLDAMAELRKNHIKELIVINNACSDSTDSIVNSYKEKLGFSVQLVHEPTKGSSRARNAGIRAASGSIIAITDDDCYPAEDWVDRIMEVFAS